MTNRKPIQRERGIYEGFAKPDDPIYNEGWSITMVPEGLITSHATRQTDLDFETQSLTVPEEPFDKIADARETACYFSELAEDARRVVLYHCNICSCLHPWAWDGDCRDDASRYSDPSDYSKRHGVSEDDIEVRSCEERAADQDGGNK